MSIQSRRSQMHERGMILQYRFAKGRQWESSWPNPHLSRCRLSLLGSGIGRTSRSSSHQSRNHSGAPRFPLQRATADPQSGTNRWTDRSVYRCRRSNWRSASWRSYFGCEGGSRKHPPALDESPSSLVACRPVPNRHRSCLEDEWYIDFQRNRESGRSPIQLGRPGGPIFHLSRNLEETHIEQSRACVWHPCRKSDCGREHLYSCRWLHSVDYSPTCSCPLSGIGTAHHPRALGWRLTE